MGCGFVLQTRGGERGREAGRKEEEGKVQAGWAGVLLRDEVVVAVAEQESCGREGDRGHISEEN